MIADHPFDSARLRFPDVDKDTCFRCNLPRAMHHGGAPVCKCVIENYRLVKMCEVADGLANDIFDIEIPDALNNYAAHIIDATMIHLADRARAFRKRKDRE